MNIHMVTAGSQVRDSGLLYQDGSSKYGEKVGFDREREFQG